MVSWLRRLLRAPDATYDATYGATLEAYPAASEIGEFELLYRGRAGALTISLAQRDGLFVVVGAPDDDEQRQDFATFADRHETAIRGCVVDHGEGFIALPALAGWSVAQVLKAGAQPAGVVARLGCDVLEQVSYAHHNKSRAHFSEVLMYGVAHAHGIQLLRADPGTRRFGYLPRLELLSPERLDGADSTAMSDVFSVGALLASLVVGRSIFTRRSEQETLQAIFDVDLGALRLPRGLEVLSAMLARHPSDRPSVDACIAALNVVAEGELALAVPQWPPDPMPDALSSGWLLDLFL